MAKKGAGGGNNRRDPAFDYSIPPIKPSTPPGYHPGAYGLPEKDVAPGTYYGIGSKYYNGGNPGKGLGPNAYDANGFNYDKAAVEYLHQVQAQNQRIAKLQSDAKRYAELYLQRAQALELASKGAYNPFIERLGAYYGIDYSTAKGKAAAKQVANRLRDLANKSYVGADGDLTGAQQIVAFENQSRKNIVRGANVANAAAQTELAKVKSGVDNRFSFSGLTNPNVWDQFAKQGLGRIAGPVTGAVGYVGGHIVEPAVGYVSQITSDALKNAAGAFQSVANYGPRGNPAGIRAAVGGLESPPRNQPGSHGLVSDSEQAKALQQYRQDVIHGTTGEEILTRLGIEDGAAKTIAGLGIDIYADPLTYVLPKIDALKDLSKVATAGGVGKALSAGRQVAADVGRARRLAFITENKVGRAVVRETAAKVRDASSIDAAVRILGRDVPREVAADVIHVGEAEGASGAQRVLEAAFAHGLWTPEEGITAQLARRAGLGTHFLPGAGSGQGVLRTLADVLGARNVARAPLSFAGVDDILDHGLSLAADVNRRWAGDLVRDLSASGSGRSVVGRTSALLDAADKLADPGFSTLVQDSLTFRSGSPFEVISNLALGKAGADGDALLNRLEKLESVLGVLKGDAGERAKALMEDQVRRQYSLPSNRTILSDVSKAIKSTPGQRLLSGKGYKDVTLEEVLPVLEQDIPEGDLKSALRVALQAETPGSGKYAAIVAAIDRVASNKDVLEAAMRAVELGGDREVLTNLLREQALHDIPAGSKFFRGVSAAVLSVVEKRPLAVLRTFSSPFKGVNEAAITDYFDRYAGFLGLDSVTRKALNREAMKVAEAVARGRTPKAAEDLYQKLIRLAFEKFGLPREVADDFFRGSVNAAKTVQAYGVDDAKELVNRPQIVTQAQTTFYLKNPNALMDAIRDELAKRGNHWAQARVVFNEKTNKTLITVLGKELSIEGGLREAEKFWKVMITTRAYAPLIGFSAGVVKGVSQGDDLWDSIQQGAEGAAIGAGVGAVGVLRYMERNWIQARISSVLYHGLTPEEAIPGLSRIYMRYQNDVYGMGANFLAPEFAEGFFINAGLSRTATDVWEVLQRTPKNLKEFVREYSRIINYQVSPETDEMMHLLLQRKAGNLTAAEFNDLSGRFLKSDAGRDWLNKMAGMGIKGKGKALLRYQQWVEQYVTPEMAKARLAPEAFGPGKGISESQLLEDPELLPTLLHRQTTESVFKKGITGIGTWWKGAINRAAYDQPALTGTRRAFYNTEAARLESRYIAAGIDHEKAVQLAGEVATRHTNEVMFRIENTSRFSSKVDFISPFQGHREFNAKTWTRLALERPGHTALYGLNAAKAFNAGAESGIFQKDPTSGQWQLSVPGSAPLSRALFGALPNQFDINLSGLLAMSEGGLSPDGDTSNPWQAIATSPIPRPGGPFWALAVGAFAKQYPDVAMNMPPGLRNLIFGPVGPSTSLLPADTDRLWQAIAGSPPPWSFMYEDQQKDDTSRWELEVGKQLIAEHRKADIAAGRSVDLDWMPSDDAIKEGVKNFYLAWGFLRGVLPAAPYPVFRDHDEFNKLLDHFVEEQAAGSGMTPEEYKNTHYSEIRNAFTEKYPAFAPFLDATTKYVGPDDFRHWEHGLTGADHAQLEKQLGQRRELRWPEYRQVLRAQNHLHEGFTALSHAEDTPGPRWQREQAIEKVRSQYPEVFKYLNTKYHSRKELATILRTYPEGKDKVKAIDRWRHQFAPPGKSTVSKGTYDGMVEDIRKNGFLKNPWAESRPPKAIWAAVSRETNGLAPTNLQVIAYVRNNLSPAEQVNYWSQAIIHNTYVSGGTDDPYKVQAAHNFYKKELADLYKNPVLQRAPRSDRSVAKAMNDTFTPISNKWKGDQSALITWLYQELDAAHVNEQKAFDSKQYSTSKMLSQRIKSLYDEIANVRNQYWRGGGFSLKDEEWMHQQARELAYFHDIGRYSDAEYQLRLEQANQRDQHNVRFIPSNEEAHFLAMPTDVRQSYIDNMVSGLSIPPGETSLRAQLNKANLDHNPFALDNSGVQSKIYWSYLTDFQKDLLAKKLPQPVLDGWKAQDPSMEKKAKGGGSYFRYGGRSFAASELSFAYALMRQYDKRNGMAKPKDYAAYLALPNNPAVRNQFLDDHPDVAAYLSAGPMHNMPAFYQVMVQNIMVKNGKWDGELLDPTGLADLAFAKTQLDVWNRRGDTKAPATYDLWLNMPSGQAKAQYLTDHPEIRQWLQLGPMANMPDTYREVVRDIMLRYHQWTASTDDGLGPVIQGYFRTPTWAREQYLQDHPELSIYWQATQSPEDAAMSDLTNQYYSIPDPEARQTFLASHPELQQHLLDQRTQRYERFLNQVAQYMGQTPDLFQHYLDDQTAVLKDLLAKFAEPNLARETHWMAPQKADTKSSEGGRKRK